MPAICAACNALCCALWVMPASCALPACRRLRCHGVQNDDYGAGGPQAGRLQGRPVMALFVAASSRVPGAHPARATSACAWPSLRLCWCNNTCVHSLDARSPHGDRVGSSTSAVFLMVGRLMSPCCRRWRASWRSRPWRWRSCTPTRWASSWRAAWTVGLCWATSFICWLRCSPLSVRVPSPSLPTAAGARYH